MRIMKLNGLRLMLQTVALVIACVAVAKAEDRAGASGLQTKLEYCTTCHGLSGQGYRGYFTMPRLAGQQQKYIENQLRAFIERRRVNPIMFNVAHSLSPSMLAALSAHFHGLNPPPLGGGPRNLVATGQTIYQEGVPEDNIAACSACHGADAKGQDEIPRLAGQLHDYIYNKLVNWSKERGQNPANPDTSAIMTPTAHNLTHAQVAAIAAYVSYLK